MCRDALSREGRSVWVSLDGDYSPTSVSSRLDSTTPGAAIARSSRVSEVFAITPSLLR